MEEYDDNDEYDDFYYDDGRFADDGYEDGEEIEDPDIPTYDELDLEGRYYEYGSRSDYNEWRNEQIMWNRAGDTNRSSNTGCMLLVLFVSFAAIFNFLF